MCSRYKTLQSNHRPEGAKRVIKCNYPGTSSQSDTLAPDYFQYYLVIREDCYREGQTSRSLSYLLAEQKFFFHFTQSRATEGQSFMLE